MKYYSNDPRWITAKFRGKCSCCGAEVLKGEPCFYWPLGKKIDCKTCGKDSSSKFQANVFDEEMLSTPTWSY